MQHMKGKIGTITLSQFVNAPIGKYWHLYHHSDFDMLGNQCEYCHSFIAERSRSVCQTILKRYLPITPACFETEFNHAKINKNIQKLLLLTQSLIYWINFYKEGQVQFLQYYISDATLEDVNTLAYCFVMDKLDENLANLEIRPVE